MPTPEYPLLILIDFEGLCIDLPNWPQLRQNCLETGVERVTGMRLPVEVSPELTDFSLLAQAFAAYGLDGERFLAYYTFKAIEEEMVKSSMMLMPRDLENALCPGLTGLMVECDSSGRAVAAPLASLVEGVTKVIIARSQLNNQLHLSCGAFSKWRGIRNDLVRLARQRAGLSGAPWPAERTLVVSRIEDDLDAAARQGVRSVFVGEWERCPRAAAQATIAIAELHDLLPKLPELIREH